MRTPNPYAGASFTYKPPKVAVPKAPTANDSYAMQPELADADEMSQPKSASPRSVLSALQKKRKRGKAGNAAGGQ